MVKRKILHERWVICKVCGNLAKLATFKKAPMKTRKIPILPFFCPVCFEEGRIPVKYVGKTYKKLEGEGGVRALNKF